MSLKGIKLVTFDATNTLLKYRVPPWDSYATAAQHHGFRGTGEDIKPYLISNIKLMAAKYPNFGRETISWISWWQKVVGLSLRDQIPDSANIDNIANHLIEEFKTNKCWSCAEGGEQLLCIVKKKKIAVGVISNFDPRLHEILHNVGLHKFIDFAVTSYEARASKPEEKIFKAAITKCKEKVDPCEALHIGDDVQKDYAGARAAGWHALVVGNHINTDTPPPPQHVFKSLDDLAIAINKNMLLL